MDTPHQPEPSALIGKLTHAGAMTVDEDHEVSGVFVSIDRATLRAAKRLPMYETVAIIEAAELTALRRDKERLETALQAERTANTELREALEACHTSLDSALNGLQWYCVEHPQDSSPADDEMQAEIQKSMDLARAALTAPLPAPAGEKEKTGQ